MVVVLSLVDQSSTCVVARVTAGDHAASLVVVAVDDAVVALEMHFSYSLESSEVGLGHVALFQHHAAVVVM